MTVVPINPTVLPPEFTGDYRIDTRAALAALLPEAVRTHAETNLLDDAPTAAALRILATIHDPYWHQFVTETGIDWAAILKWGRSTLGTSPRGMSNSQRVLLEIAASLAGHPGARVALLYAIRVLSRHHLLSVLDALRICAEGLAR